MRKVVPFFVSTLLVGFLSISAWAVNPDEVLEDPVLEQRARALSVNIRCLVCQNQSIDDSDAQLARDLRVLVREQLVEGRTDKEILDFLVDRYGEFVLLKPKFGTHTIALWGFPVLILLVGGIAAYRIFVNRPKIDDVALSLSEEEKKALDQAIDKET